MVKVTTRTKKDSPTVAKKATDTSARAKSTKSAASSSDVKPIALDITLPSKPTRPAPKRATRKPATNTEEPDKRPKRAAAVAEEDPPTQQEEEIADKENVAVANKKVSRDPPAKRQTKKRRVEATPAVDEEEAAVEPDTAGVDTENVPPGPVGVLDVKVGITKEAGVKSIKEWMTQWEAEVLVVVAYTKANTPGCGKQCVAFSNATLPAKTALLGLSLDNDASQTSFVERKSLKFPLVHTGGVELAAATNCLTTTGKMVRSVVIVKNDGEIIYEKHKVAPEPCCVEAVKYLTDRANEVTEDEEAESKKAPRKPRRKQKA